MASGLALEPEYIFPCAIAVAAMFAPSRALPAGLARAARLAGAAALGCAMLLRLAVLGDGLFNPAVSSWNAGMQAIAGAWLNGQSMYPAVQEGLFYRWVYGPLHYEVLSLAQMLFGIGDPMVGLPMVLAEIGAAWATWRVARRMGVSRAASGAAVAVMVLELALLGVGGVRSDQLLVLLAALALLAAQRVGGGVRAGFWIGLCGGLAMALKFTGFAYVLPVLLPLLLRPELPRVRLLAWVAAGGVLGAVTPYLLPGAMMTLPVFLEETGGYRATMAAFSHNLLFVLLAFLLPLVWASPETRRARLWSLTFVAIPLAPLFVIACNGGAGPWHFAPLLPAITIVLAQSLDERRDLDCRRAALIASVILLCLLEARHALPALLDQGNRARHAQAQAEIRTFLADHPGESVAIGSARGSRGRVDLLSFQPEIPRSGQPLRFMDQAFQYVSTEANSEIAIRKLMDDCSIRYWINAPGAPFAAHYHTATLREAFLARYRPLVMTRHMTVWACRDLSIR